MPPFIPKRRLNDTVPPSSTSLAKRARLADSTESHPKQKRADSSNNSESSLSDVDSDEFEDVPSGLKPPQKEELDDHDESDDDVDWEDAAAPEQTPHAPLPTENISISINKEDEYIDYGAAANKTAKKGPSRREKEVRMRTHQVHVQFLVYHNLLRNHWACDKEVQQTLVGQLPSQIRKEVDKWKRASGLAGPEETKTTPKSNKRGEKGQTEE